MEEKVFFEGELGRVCGVHHKVEGSKEIVIVVHGFSSTKETGAIASSNEINAAGVSAIRIDLDNQGESELDFKTSVTIPNYIKQVEATMDFVKSIGYTEVSLLGTSFGGIVVLSTALSHPEIKRMFLRAPVVDWQRLLDDRNGDKINEFRSAGLIPHVNKHGDTLYYTFDCYESAKEFSMYERAAELKMPIQFLHGDSDTAVNVKYSQEVVSLFPNAELYVVKGANHGLSVDGDYTEALKVLRDFFSKEV